MSTSASADSAWATSVTMADVCLVPQIANARRFRCPLDDFPRSVAIADAGRGAAGVQGRAPFDAGRRDVESVSHWTQTTEYFMARIRHLADV